MEPMKFQPFKLPSEQPKEVHNHGCIIGASCAGRAVSSMNGPEVCCQADCNDCSVSESFSNGVLTTTCVCSDGDDSLLVAKDAKLTAVHNDGCDVGDSCDSRGSSMVGGQKFCCPADCANDCSLEVSQGKVISASCHCAQPVKGWTTAEKCVAFAGFVILLGAGAYALHKQQSPELSQKLLQ